MPILRVEIVLRPGETLPPGLAAALAESAGQLCGAPAGAIWVRLTGLPAWNYAENDTPAGSVHPVFVNVLKAALPPPERLAVEAAQLTEVIARLCGRPAENVHLFFEPAGAGRVAFGGRLVGG
jgi:phenylpyruvate tautomerase PptA (4-oxalocrotonate tautomerase family)